MKLENPPPTGNAPFDNWLRNVVTALNNRFFWNDFKIQTVADDGNIDLATSGKGGFGYVQAGDNEEYVFFSFTNAGVVTFPADTWIPMQSSNAVKTDTDAKLCVFDNGTNVRIRNRLGASKQVAYALWYAE